ncbi:hypothetical protein K439DRAFT_96021 [Ramaria rubella]|nr:hypothetical protein K439DRAFT_96021 [Ramaria rubella]
MGQTQQLKMFPRNVCIIDDNESLTDVRPEPDGLIPMAGVKDYPPLTILSSQRPSTTCGVSQIMLQQIPEQELPMHFPNAPHLHHILHFHLVRAATADIPDAVPVIHVGPSGRGIYISNGTLFAFKPISLASPFGTIKGTPDLEHPKTIGQSQGAISNWSITRQVLAFDDAMGRVAVGNEYGAVAVFDCMCI